MNCFVSCDPNKAGILVTLYDNAYKGYSSPGTSTVVVMMLSGYEPWRRFEADYFAGRKDAYLKEKERIAGALIKEAEKWAIPGLSSMIEVEVRHMDNKSVLVVMDIQEGFLGKNPRLPIRNENKSLLFLDFTGA